jgi:hypothetical protein
MDPKLEAQRIASDWPLYVEGRLPAALAAAIAAFEAADAVQPPSPAIDVDSITAKNAAQAVLDAVDAAVRAEHLGKARTVVVDALAARVRKQAANAVPEILEGMETEFRASVAEFDRAVRALPADIRPAALVAGGPEVVDAYHRAVDAQKRLQKLDNFIASMSPLAAQPRGNVKVLRLLRPTNRDEYAGLLTAANSRAEGELNPVWCYAIEENIAWALTDPWTAKQVADEINAMPVVQKPVKFANVNKR